MLPLQLVAEQRSKALHERQRLSTEKRALERARSFSACTATCEHTARIAQIDVSFEAPFGGLGSFSCKGAFYSRNAYFELQSQWLAKTGRSTCEVGGHCKLAPSLPVGHLLYRKAMVVGLAGVWKWHFRLQKIWLTFVTFCGF